MKRLTLAVAGLLLVSVLPTLASAGFDETEFRGTIVLDGDDPVVSPLSFQPTDAQGLENIYEDACEDSPSACSLTGEDFPDLPDGEDSKDTDGAPTWLYVRGQSEERYTVTLESNGPVVGTIDVYKYYPETGGNTPPCLTQHLTQVYPDDGQVASIEYLTKLRQVTLGSHGASAVGTGVPVLGNELTLPPSETGYIVVFDARAGTGAGEGIDSVGKAKLTYTVSTVSSETPFSVTHTDNEWLQDPGTVILSRDTCLEQGVPLPPVLPSSSAADIPGLGQAFDARDLLDESLPEA